MKTSQKVCPITLCVALFLLMMSYPASSQEVIEVKTTRAQMSEGMQPCYFVEIPQAKLKTVQQNWIKKLQEGSKIKAKEINQEVVLPKALKTEISTDTVNIYSILFQKENRISLNVFLEFGNVFFKPNQDKTDLASEKRDNNIKNYIRSFGVEQYKIAVADELEVEQKTLETLQNDLEKLEKNNEKMTKDIASLENDIDKTEREIKEMELNIDLKNQAILAQTASIQTITGEAERQAAEEQLKSLEKDRNKLEKERSKAKDDISSDQSKIRQNNKDIEEGIRLIEQKKEAIEIQAKVVTKVQAKLDGIN